MFFGREVLKDKKDIEVSSPNKKDKNLNLNIEKLI